MFDQAKQALKLLAVLVSLTLFGCASTTNEPGNLSGDVGKAQAAADAAMKKATEAEEIANNAQKTADEAKAIAERAQATCGATGEKCSRMFEKSMQK